MASHTTSRSATSMTSSSGSVTSSSSASSSDVSAVMSKRGAEISTSNILAAHAEAMGPLSAPPHSALLFEPSRGMTPYISLGPVVGLTTDTSCRILIETPVSCEVCCYLTDAGGTQHGSRRDVKGRHPFVFSFENLKPSTYYRISFDLPVPGLVKSGFCTLPRGWKLGRHGARLAFVSHNCFYSSRQEIKHSADMWRELYKHLNNREVDYVLHVGDNVYADADRYNAKTGGCDVRHKSDCPRLEAKALLESVPFGEWDNMKHEVLEVFRQAYRTTWSHPTTKHCLANSPNLFMMGQHEILHNLVGVPGGAGENEALESFLTCCAYETFNEYCRILHEPYATPKNIMQVGDHSGQAYHFHALGDVGFMFLDTRAFAAGLHREEDLEEENKRFPMLGANQWADIEYTLADRTGYASRCRLLIVCSATPVALCGEQGFLKGASEGVGARAALGASWNSPQHMPEASLLLTRLFDWRASKAGEREVVLVGGGRDCGGMTDIADLRFMQDPRLKIMKQIVTGPVGASTGGIGKMSHGMKSSLMSTNGIGLNHQFQHYSVVKSCNFAVLDATLSTDGSVKYLAQHYLAKGTTRTTNKAISSTYNRKGFSGKPVTPTSPSMDKDIDDSESVTSRTSGTSLSTSEAQRRGYSHSMSTSEARQGVAVH